LEFAEIGAVVNGLVHKQLPHSEGSLCQVSESRGSANRYKRLRGRVQSQVLSSYMTLVKEYEYFIEG